MKVEKLIDLDTKGHRVDSQLQSTLYYRGGCLSESRGNKYSVGFSYVRVDPGHNDSFWLDWARGRFVEFERTSEVDRTVLFDQGRFMVRGRMEQGCTPLLQVDFMPGPMFQGDLAVSAEGIKVQDFFK